MLRDLIAVIKGAIRELKLRRWKRQRVRQIQLPF
jgi:hypothetical protein